MGGGQLSLLERIIVSLPAFLLAIILHELAHGYVAYLLGDDTAKRAGRLTLSPLAHLDPFGALFFIVSSLSGFGFGWAKPVPVALERLRNPRRDEVLVTVAGPGANFAQAVAWAVLLRLALRFAPGTLGQSLAIFCLYGISINLLLMIFNLLPIPPLDGSHVAARVLGIGDPHLVDRLAPLGFVVLFLFVSTPAFGWLINTVLSPLMVFFLPRGFW